MIRESPICRNCLQRYHKTRSSLIVSLAKKRCVVNQESRSYLKGFMEYLHQHRNEGETSMALSDQVRELLKSIEKERRKRVRYSIVPLERNVSKLQINIYPVEGDPAFQIFDLQAGLTVRLQRTIRQWFESFMHAAL